MSEQNQSHRDSALENGEFDAHKFSGDVDGPGLVSSAGAGQGKSIPLRANPPETKSLSKKGAFLGVGAIALIALGMVYGVMFMGGNRVEDPSAAASASTTAAATQAPDIEALNKAAGEKETAQSNTGTDTGTLPPPPNGTQPAPPPGGATGPSHSDQYKDWLERHRYDRLRARHMAFDQAHLAPLVGDSAGSNQPVARGPGSQMAAAAMPQAGSGVMPAGYTGQPRPERIPPEMLAQLAIAQGQQGPGQGQTQGRAPGASSGFAGFAQQGQGQQDRSARHEAFAESDRDVGYLNQPVRDSRPGHEIAAGSIIPAVMLSAINSDLPGSIVAQVRSDVFSTFDYQTLLVPAGSRLIGRYSSDIATGQERVLVAWDEMIFPNGRRINLEGMGAVDGQGAAGMTDQVTTHFWRIWGNALMISAIGVAAQQSQPQNANQNNTPTSSQQAAAAATNSLNETAQQVLRRNLNISPTLEIRPGFTFSVMVNRSIALPAYRN